MRSCRPKRAPRTHSLIPAVDLTPYPRQARLRHGRTGKIRIGIGGWTYEPWRGVFYPPDLPQKRELEFASRQLTAIEINGTFYSRQSPKSWEAWAAAVPDDFQFTVKASRFCVTRPKLADAGEGIGNFFAQGLRRSGRSSARRCGCSPSSGSSIAKISRVS